ncbi:MAG TPA: universal stress protein [Terriglobales bacterium]|jgi:nucleotide-binding universal stress UspA family protein
MKLLEPAVHVTLKNVLFATDFSAASNAALPFALALANRYGAKLYAAHALSPEAYLLAAPESWPYLQQMEEQQQQLAAERLEAQLREVPHQVLSPVGDISDVLFRLVRDHEVDLIVLGTHGRSGFKKMLMGSVAEKIFRQAPCPVLTVGPNVQHAGDGLVDFQTIIFATDLSPESEAAMPYAVSLAQQRGARLVVLHVIEQPEAGTVDCDANANFVLRQLEEMVPPDPDLWFHPDYAVEFGAAEERILQTAADRHADLIVLGVRSWAQYGGPVTRFAHSTAQSIVSRAGCPVLTVRG